MNQGRGSPDRAQRGQPASFQISPEDMEGYQKSIKQGLFQVGD